LTPPAAPIVVRAAVGRTRLAFLITGDVQDLVIIQENEPKTHSSQQQIISRGRGTGVYLSSEVITITDHRLVKKQM